MALYPDHHDCNVVTVIVFEEGFRQPIKRTKQLVSSKEVVDLRPCVTEDLPCRGTDVRFTCRGLKSSRRGDLEELEHLYKFILTDGVSTNIALYSNSKAVINGPHNFKCHSSHLTKCKITR
ncbi:hypothetical protein TNCV_2552111 [Trichonephila clavipes]|nr:hypothetical protein TNCV_2552111 [Trichonephila clavipes]